MNLTAAQLKAIHDWYSGPMGNARPYIDPTTGQMIQQSGGGEGTLYGYDPTQTGVGQSYDRYQPDGAANGQGRFQKVGSGLSEFSKVAAAAALMYFGLPPGTLGANAGGTAALDGGLSYGGGSMAEQAAINAAGNIGNGAATGAGYGEFGAGADGVAEAAGGGGGFDGAATGPNFSQGYTDAGTAGGALDTGYTSATAGIPYTGAPGGSLLSQAGGLLDKYGKYILPLAGAVMGSKGSQQSVDTTKRMDPRLDGAVFGADGLVPRAQGLLAQQMSPQGQAGWQNMQNVGQGLLNQPMAGNGYQMFAGRKL